MSDTYFYPAPEDFFNNAEVRSYIEQANNNLAAIGFTEHGLAHAKLSSDCAYRVLKELGYPSRTCELAAIAGYIHDIGNTVNRVDHAHSGALMAFTLLNKINMDPKEIALICAAIGHHDEKTAYPVSTVAAALIISDKSDVRRSRVRNMDLASDIHDRVNYAVVKSSLEINKNKMSCIFYITIDTTICPVMEYFEIFLERMVLCRKSAAVLGLDFELIINNTKLL